MPFDIDPRVDFAFQRLFGTESNKPLLIDLLNAVLTPAPGEEVVDVRLRNPLNLRAFDGDKLSIVDLRACDQLGRWFLVEMQIVGRHELGKRFLFYWAETYTGQLSDGDHYSELKPTILIAFLCDNLFPDVPEYHLTFRLMETRRGIRFTEDIEIHTIELAKLPPRLKAKSSQLDRWSYFLNFSEGQPMSQIPQQLLNDPVFQQAMDELKKMSGNPADREEYRRRLKFVRDRVWEIDAALKEGREEGIEAAKFDSLIEQIRFCERLLAQPRTPSEQLKQLPLHELEQRAENLQQQCYSRFDADNDESES